MCLLDNREVREGWQALKGSVAGMFTKHGAEIVSARRWEERRLAYPIKHQQRGTYLLVYFNGEPDMITPLRRELELSESIMRNLVLTCDKVPDEAHQPEEEFDASEVQVEDLYRAPPPASAPPEKEAEKETEKAAEKETEKQTEKAAEKETEKQTEKQTEKAAAEAASEAKKATDDATPEAKAEAAVDVASDKPAAEDSGDSKPEVKE